MSTLAPGTPVLIGGTTLPAYGRVRRAHCPPGILRVRLTVDHTRGRRGQSLYIRAILARPYRPGRHASGVRRVGPRWFHLRRRN